MSTRRHRTAWTLAALAAFAASTRVALPGASPARHRVTLWTFDDDASRPGFVDAVRALGADSVSASPSADVAALPAAGLSWYEDAAAGKGTLDLRERDWKPAWDRTFAARTKVWPDEPARARPICLRDPDVFARLESETARNARRAAKGAFAVALADEPSMTVRANPVDWCLCGRCVAAFRDEMRAKYAELSALNDAWATKFASWIDVRPWTTAEMKARIKGVDPSKWNLAPWMETRAFQDRSFAAVVARLRDVASKAAPDVPCGITGTQAPSAFGGWDYGLLRNSMSFVEPYDVGLALPICRDLFPRGTVIAQTVFPSGDDDLLPRWRLWRGVARGANATIVWSSHDALTRDGKPSLAKYGAALAADLALLAAPDGIGAKLARAWPVAGVAILLSQASIDAQWMLDSEKDGDTWPRRFGSYEATHSTAIASREAAWRACGAGAPRFVDVRDLASSVERDDLHGCVLAPDLLCLSAVERAALMKWTADGKTIVSDACVGRFDELGRAASPLPVAAQFASPGVWVEPEFKSHSFGSKPCVFATATRENGGPAPRVELGVYEDAGSTYVVAVPAWDATTDDSGGAVASIPRTTLTFTFRLDAPRDVVELRSGKQFGRVESWSSTSDAAGGLVFELR